jgi:SAM-dependent methyltransferase
LFNAKQDLIDFTGLEEPEVMLRLQRLRQFHFEGEHAWWNPQTRTTLAWFYRTSVNYLFGNAIHQAVVHNLGLKPADGPVLSYSEGVGNNLLWLANQGIESYYFGIGVNEMSFARFRVMSRGLGHLVHFIEPYVWDVSNGRDKRKLRFEPLFSVPNKQYGVICAFDVLEHIPDYHYTLAHLASTLRVGGLFCETTPFGPADAQETSVHVPASKNWEQAMGDCGLQRRPKGQECWIKVKDVDCMPKMPARTPGT